MAAALARTAPASVVTLVAVTVVACAARGRPASPAPAAPARRGAAAHAGVAVRVDNRGTRPLTILFSRGGQLTRLGDVRSVSATVFRLRRRDLGDVGAEQYLVARSGPLGVTLRSDRLIVQPGQTVTWVLPDQLSLNSLSVE